MPASSAMAYLSPGCTSSSRRQKSRLVEMPSVRSLAVSQALSIVCTALSSTRELVLSVSLRRMQEAMTNTTMPMITGMSRRSE